MSAAAAWLAALMPVLVLLAAFRLAARVSATRAEAIECQIAMTDAIHRDFGAVVAPTVTRTLAGGWRVRVAVPFERSAVVARVLEIARETVAPPVALGGRDWEIVLVAQAPPVAQGGRAGSHHAFENAPREIPAGP